MLREAADLAASCASLSCLVEGGAALHLPDLLDDSHGQPYARTGEDEEAWLPTKVLQLTLTEILPACTVNNSSTPPLA